MLRVVVKLRNARIIQVNFGMNFTLDELTNIGMDEEDSFDFKRLAGYLNLTEA